MKKSDIIKAFKKLNEELSKRNVKGEVGVFGGAAMVLGFNARISTKDVDAIFVPASKVREAAKKVADDMDLPEDWMNDAVKLYVPVRPKEKKVIFSADHLTVWIPEPEYLVAMKGIAARFDSLDAADLKTLIEHLHLKTVESVFDIIEHYYPKKNIPAKTQYFIEELFWHCNKKKT